MCFTGCSSVSSSSHQPPHLHRILMQFDQEWHPCCTASSVTLLFRLRSHFQKSDLCLISNHIWKSKSNLQRSGLMCFSPLTLLWKKSDLGHIKGQKKKNHIQASWACCVNVALLLCDQFISNKQCGALIPAAAVGCPCRAVAAGLAGGQGSAGWSVSSAGTEAGSSGTPEGSLWRRGLHQQEEAGWQILALLESGWATYGCFCSVWWDTTQKHKGKPIFG